MTSNGRERRREARHPIEASATIQLYRNGEAVDGTTIDVSSSGLRLKVMDHSRLRVGDEVICEVVPPQDEGKGKGVWKTGRLVRINQNEVAIQLSSGALDPILRQPCPHCKGSGSVKSVSVICDEIHEEAIKKASLDSAGKLNVRAHPEIAEALKAGGASLIADLEKLTKQTVNIQADAALHWEQYEIS